jgi:ABC-type xylose transport system permease subunit
MQGFLLNVVGVAIVVLFVNTVDWSMWVSVPVGIGIGAVFAITVGYIRGRFSI